LETALHHLNGKAGLASWQWLFLIDGIIKIPFAVYGYFALPDTPANSKAYWLAEEDLSLAAHRLEAGSIGDEKVKGAKTKISTRLLLKVVVKSFSNLQVYAF
jgi:hypothetical protein